MNGEEKDLMHKYPDLIPIVETAARAAAKVTVEETFKVFGIDPDNPFEVQRDMAHLRWWRQIVESSVKRVAVVATTTIVLSILGGVGFMVFHFR